MFQSLLGKIGRRRCSQLLSEAPKRLTLPNTCRVGNVRYANVISQMGLDEPAHFSYPSGGGPRTPSVRLLTGKCEHIEHKMRECKTSVYLKALSATDSKALTASSMRVHPCTPAGVLEGRSTIGWASFPTIGARYLRCIANACPPATKLESKVTERIRHVGSPLQA